MTIAILAFILVAIFLGLTFYARRHPIEMFVRVTRSALRRAGLQKKSLATPRGPLVYWAGGRGTATLVLVHGVNDQAGSWAPLAGALMARWRLIVPDLAGHGESGPREGALPMDEIVAGLEAVLDAEQETRVVLAGNSMGGWISVLFAAAHPERVAHLVLEDASGMAWNLSGVPLFPKSRDEVAALLRAVAGPEAPRPADYVLDAYLAAGPRSPMARIFEAGIVGHLIDPHLPSLTMPLTLIWGANDGLLPLAYAEALEQKIAGATLHVIDGAAHIPHRQKPKEVLRLLDEVLATGGTS